MKLLWIVPYVPSLIRVRPYNLVRALAQRGHEITLLTLWTSPAELEDVEGLRAMGLRVEALRLPKSTSLLNSFSALPTRQPLQASYCWLPALEQRISQLLGDHVPGNGHPPFDLLHVEHLRGARYGLAARSRLPVVWDSVDSISLLFRKAASGSRSRFNRLITRLELGRTERYEPHLAHSFDRVLVTSMADRNAFLDLDSSLAESHITVLPNGVDLDYFTPAKRSQRKVSTVVISGKMSYHANVSMALHMANEIMPLVWERRPDVKLLVVGKDPSREVQALSANPNITVTGTVSDLRPYLQQAAVAATPIPYGVGIQNKALEAMACATPVVSSPQAVSALSVRPGQDLLVAETPLAFAEALIGLLDDPQRREELGQAGRHYVETYHRWDTIAADLEGIYLAAIAAYQGKPAAVEASRLQGRTAGTAGG